MSSFFRFFPAGLCTLILITGLQAQDPVMMNDSMARGLIRHRADSLLNGPWLIRATGYQKQDSTQISRIDRLTRPDRFRIYADRQLAYAPFREAVLDSLEATILDGLRAPYADFQIEWYAGKKNLRELVPLAFRESISRKDRSRAPGRLNRKSPPLVRKLSKPWLSGAALDQANIALWHSHGWYYEPELDRWEWQRARLFQTVEDIYPMAYTLPFLVPMLENAGAMVLLPRERDWQVNEVVVDNNGSSGNSLFIAGDHLGESGPFSGFGLSAGPLVDENPFRLGTVREMVSDRRPSESIQWIPEIPEDGSYAVYISYRHAPESVDDAHYRVYHRGGVAEFEVNQQMGGGTWIYLGHFDFKKGLHPEQGRVVLDNGSSRRGRLVSADAVRFGGGMGHIARQGYTSGRPSYQEGARYYLQYAGMPDSLVWKLNEKKDYNDDYQSRGEWVNYLMGAPSGPLADRQAPGLGIPIDLAFAFHTDAGITGNDTVIGTLGIYSSTHDQGYFPNGISRMASRDLTDLIQSQIVDDARQLYDPAWTRRGLWDRAYSEAFRPNVPTMLLELFSHQNFIDMRYGQEPLFRFHVSRSIYKGMLRFLHHMYGMPLVVQPLPVDHFHCAFGEGGSIRLQWSPVDDALEPSAAAEQYLVYTRINEGVFDQGVLVSSPEYILENPLPDTIYSFRVSAVNRGGESFPSEVLSACRLSQPKGRAAIVNAFDRVSGPAFLDDEKHAGFMNMIDQGVPWGVDLHTVGDQYDFVRSSPWLDDDSPGHGASYADMEGQVIPGNSFDFSFVHGCSLREAGYSFVSCSDEVLEAGGFDLSAYELVDYLAGEERSTRMPKNDSTLHFQVWPEGVLDQLAKYLDGGGKLLVSGAHIATDMHEQQQDSLIGSLLKMKWRTSNASRLGQVYATDPAFAPRQQIFEFNTGYDPGIYTVEGADALEPADSTAVTLLRYAENNMSAAVAYRDRYGVVSLGFPFEAIRERPMRDEFMRLIINYLMTIPEDD